MRALMLAGLMFAVCATGARAQGASANNILPGCRSSISLYDASDPFVRGTCVGEVVGVRDTAVVAGFVCPPKDTTDQQVIRMVVQYVQVRPQRLSETFTSLALEALYVAWPCK